jgi:hypothetical protein
MTWRCFEITVAGHEPFVMAGMTHGKVRAAAFDSYRECRYGAKFSDFMRLCKVRVCETPANDGYDYVRRNYGVDPKVGQRVELVNEGRTDSERVAGVVVYPGLSTASVHVVVDGRDFAVRVHPTNVAAITAPAEGA